jgi:transcriptional regulator with XRE-family HTH domain
MREKDRKLLRRRLDEEMCPFRRAAREPISTDGLLRAVREALRIPLAEIAEKGGVGHSTVQDFEMRESKRTITLKSLGRMAEAMGCKVVYGVVPLNGRTFEYVAEERLWKKVLSAGTEGPGTKGLGD